MKMKKPKPKIRRRPDLKDKSSCPYCGKELTVHGLTYTHKKSCKAKLEIEKPVPVLEAPPMPTLGRTVTTVTPTKAEFKETPTVVCSNR